MKFIAKGIWFDECTEAFLNSDPWEEFDEAGNIHKWAFFLGTRHGRPNIEEACDFNEFDIIEVTIED